ncbi:MRG/MORF4L-binding protein [Anthonomus grandis grandis]|uniref:MRG/MORF4L-binding protein n=1 Tax=Anthonomus grandis grandis TaxID=2921223 RepID=UPI0021663E61|nr:MRG/MORF4L-binding protein [Anthonomus grandis grandis]
MEDIEWTVVNEGQLLDAMVGHKPVGINKYFQMALICDKFANNLCKDVDPEKIWEHLQTMYNLEALDENESIPFPNHEKEFSLPDSEFGELLKKVVEETFVEPSKGGKELKNEDVKSPNKPIKEATPRRDSKEGKDNTKATPAKKEVKKEPEKSVKQGAKGRSATPKEDKKFKGDDTPKPAKRTRGSLKTSNDDSGSSGKSSPVTVTPTGGKRRRI